MIGTDAGIEIVNRSESNMGTEIGMGLVQVDETAIAETANRIIFCYSVLYVECSGRASSLFHSPRIKQLHLHRYSCCLLPTFIRYTVFLGAPSPSSTHSDRDDGIFINGADSRP
jgi:hypothetical protein